MYRLALNMLFGDLAKLAMLLCGLAFSALLMAQQSSVFFGIMSWTYTPMVNIRAQVWVSDPMVEQVNDAKPLRDTDLGRVRSVDGVAWAAPLHTSFVQARMQDGNFKLITLVGIDADTFAGAPAVLSQGRIEDLRLPDTVIVDEWGAALMGRMGVGPDGKPRNTPLKVGDTFEINDIQARIVGICDVYHALREARPYRPALPHDTVMGMIVHGDGSDRLHPGKFDPDVLAAFRASADDIRDAFDAAPE